jgi:hypothetical protein
LFFLFQTRLYENLPCGREIYRLFFILQIVDDNGDKIAKNRRDILIIFSDSNCDGFCGSCVANVTNLGTIGIASLNEICLPMYSRKEIVFHSLWMSWINYVLFVCTWQLRKCVYWRNLFASDEKNNVTLPMWLHPRWTCVTVGCSTYLEIIRSNTPKGVDTSFETNGVEPRLERLF